MKKQIASLIVALAASGALAVPALAADAAKPMHHHHKAAAVKEAKEMPAKHHHKHGKPACGDYAYQSAEWNACHK
jgi:hypothetical protein